MEDTEKWALEILGERDYSIFEEMITRLGYDSVNQYFLIADEDHEKALNNPTAFKNFDYIIKYNSLIKEDERNRDALIPIKYKRHKKFFDQNSDRIFEMLNYGMLKMEFMSYENDITYLENRAVMYEAYFAFRESLGESEITKYLKYIRSLISQRKNQESSTINQVNIEITNQLSIQNFDQRVFTNHTVNNNYSTQMNYYYYYYSQQIYSLKNYSLQKNEKSIKIQFPSTGNIELLHVFFEKLYHLGLISSLELFIAPFKGKLIEGHKRSRWQADNTALIFLIEILGKKGMIRVPLNRSKAIRLCFLDIDGNEFKENSLNSLASSKRIMSLSKENLVIENFVKDLENNDVTLIFETFKTVYSS